MCQINNQEIYDAIRTLYFECFSKAKMNGLTTDIEIHLRGNLAEELGLGEKLTVGFGDFIVENVPIIIDDSIKERQVENSKATISDIYLFDPKWLIEE